MRPVSLVTVTAAMSGADSHFVVSGCSCADAWADSRERAATAFRKRSVMVAFPRLVKCTDIMPSCPCPASTSSHLTYQENSFVEQRHNDCCAATSACGPGLDWVLVVRKRGSRFLNRPRLQCNEAL